MRLAWVAGVAALLWGLTGLSHPLMVWSSPRPAVFGPPAEPLALEGGMAAGAVMGLHDIAQASLVRAVGGEDGKTLLWLIRESPTAPARYFDSRSGREIPEEDRRRAEALARHFAGDLKSPVKDAVFLDAFTPDYPEVNRLLPVWRIAFDRPDGLVAYVDTGHRRLSALSNDIRRAMLWTFTNIHTLAFLPGPAEGVRVLLILMMVGSLWAAAMLAFGLLVAKRGSRRGAGRWHRLLGYGAVIPALMFSSSGLLHLLHDVAGEPGDIPLSRQRIRAADVATVPPAPSERLVALVAVGQAGGAMWHMRTETAAAPGPADIGHSHDPHARHAPQMQGMASGASADLWIDAASGRVREDGVESLVRTIASDSGRPADDIRAIERIDAFTAEYGFINKRLPVWRVTFADPGAARLFVDPVEGLIAGRADDFDLIEGRVFNLLHKWRWLDGIGTRNRDMIIMSFVALILAVTLFGWRLRLRRRR